MKVIGAILLLIGAICHQVWWMPAVFTVGLIVLALAIEKSLSIKIETIRERLSHQAFKTAVKEHQEEQSHHQPVNGKSANTNLEPISGSQ